jgi:ELWxxDGT repeat protein
LFRTDGTPNGTRRVETSQFSTRAVPPEGSVQPWSSGEGPLCFYNNVREIWKTDGTERGTIRLATSSQNSGGIFVAPRGYSSIVTVPSGRVFWLAGSPTRLMTSDGHTEDGAQVVFTGSNQLVIGTSVLAPLGDRVVFAVPTGSSVGSEAIISDGTPEGTIRLGPASIGSFPQWFVPFNGRVYFTASDSQGTELWSTDGTPQGTQRFADLVPGSGSSNPEMLTVSEGRLWFTAISQGQSRAMWHTDGVSPPVVVPDLVVASASIATRPVTFASGVVLYTGSSVNLVRTSGVTRLSASNVFPNPDTSLVVVQASGTMPEQVYFMAEQSSPASGLELFAATSAPGSAALVANLMPGPQSSAARPLAPIGNGRLLLSANVSSDDELYITDGTSAGTTLLANLAITHTNANPSVVVEGDFPEQAAFTADSTAWGSELFTTDGTSAGTRPIIEFTPGPAGNRRSILKADDGWFSVYGGSSTSTREIRYHAFLNEIGVTLGTASNFGFQPATIGDNLVFTASGLVPGTPGPGTAWGASPTFGPSPLILVPSDRPTSLGRFVTFGDLVYFGAYGSSVGSTFRRLYRTDGTSQGTAIAWDSGLFGPDYVFPYIVGSTSTALIVSNGVDYPTSLYAHTPANGNTVLLRQNMVIRSASTTTGSSTLMNDVLYFTAYASSTSDVELWRTDATTAGTYRVRDIVPSGEGSFPGSFSTLQTDAGPRIFFAATTPTHGHELWTSDGTEAGTRMVVDLYPGPRSSSPTLTFATGTKVYFAADDGLTGNELWETDGTEAGTRQLADLNPGPESSLPQNLSVVNGRLWFSATTRSQGRELYSMPLTPPGAECNYDFNQDENVDLTDAQQMAQVFVGLLVPDPIWLDGDLNGDENADLTDAQILAAFVVSGVCPI